MHNIKLWVEAGCSPTDLNAPSIERLHYLECHKLILDVSSMRDITPKWALTADGYYEAMRNQMQINKKVDK